MAVHSYSLKKGEIWSRRRVVIYVSTVVALIPYSVCSGTDTLSIKSRRYEDYATNSTRVTCSYQIFYRELGIADEARSSSRYCFDESICDKTRSSRAIVRQKRGATLVDDNDEQAWLEHIATIKADTSAAGFEEAVRALTPLIEQIAEEVCIHFMVAKQVRADFLDIAVAEIVLPRKSNNAERPTSRIAKYDPTKGSLPAWLWTVLKRRLFSVLRARSLRAKREQHVNDADHRPDIAARASSPGMHFLSYSRLRNTPFSNRDLDQIATWPVLDRILILVTYSLWPKVPADTWHGWCTIKGLPDPFPPMPHIRKRGEWIGIVAESVSASRQALQNRVRRRLEDLKLKPLEYMDDLEHIWSHSHGR